MWYAAIAAHYGYAFLIPDHEGMKAAYTANIHSGHVILDAVRAMKTTPALGMQHSWTGMLGYSGGGMASLWALNLRQQYAPKCSLLRRGSRRRPHRPAILRSRLRKPTQ